MTKIEEELAGFEFQYKSLIVRHLALITPDNYERELLCWMFVFVDSSYLLKVIFSASVKVIF